MQNGHLRHYGRTKIKLKYFDYIFINLDTFSGTVDLDIYCCNVPVAPDKRSLSFFLINMLTTEDSIKTKFDDFIHKNRNASPLILGAI